MWTNGEWRLCQMRGAPKWEKSGGSGQFHHRYLVLVIHRPVLGPESPEMSKTQLLPEDR